MSEIRPFRGLRPVPHLAAEVAAPPYDVVTTKEARLLAQNRRWSFLHVGRAEIDFPEGTDPYDDRVYAKAAANLKLMVSEGVLVRDPVPCLYVYQQQMGDHIQTGVVAAVSVAEYEAGLIKRHELTRKDKEDDRARHVAACNANAGPVFLTHRPVKAIDAVVNKIIGRPPACAVVCEDGVGHRVWVVDQPDEVETLVHLFAEIPALYVADGHHRTMAAVRHAQAMRRQNPAPRKDAPYEYFMAVVFPSEQLRIMPYNRVVRDLNGLSSSAFLERVQQRFHVTRTSDPIPKQPRTFCMYLDGAWWSLRPQPELVLADDPIARLDVSILQDNLLGPVLGVEDPRSDQRIDFIGGIRGTSALEKRCAEGWAVAFSLFPTTIEQLMEVADAGKVMPPKSTWFEPKLRSGLIVRLLDE